MGQRRLKAGVEFDGAGDDGLLHPDRLAEIRVEIATGTLVVRQMTATEHEAASEAAR
jgi:hypothetical protein